MYSLTQNVMHILLPMRLSASPTSQRVAKKTGHGQPFLCPNLNKTAARPGSESAAGAYFRLSSDQASYPHSRIKPP